MVKQERAARTRNALVQAAAAHFDRDGYAGTSLNRISKAAGISMGALTFHFASKGELADAVSEVGRSTTRAVLDDTDERPADPLRQLAMLTVALTRLLETSDTVRATVRLERERPGSSSWWSCWLPTVSRLLQQADEENLLRPTARPEVVVALVTHLVGGAEMLLRHRHTMAAGTPVSSAALVGRVWKLLLTGISAASDDDALALSDSADVKEG